MSTLRHYPLGSTITGSPHSVCGSLPTMADIIAYEEGDPPTRAALCAGYPRFIDHPLVQRLRGALEIEGGHPAGSLILTATSRHAQGLLDFVGVGSARAPRDGVFPVELPLDADLHRRARRYLQHTGAGISSREAEAHLLARGLLAAPHPESRQPSGADERIRHVLHAFYNTRSPDDIFLTRGGMNAFFAAFQAIRAYQEPRGRHRWIQLGWLYVDTMEVLARFSSEPPVTFHDVLKLDTLEIYLGRHGSEVAAIVTETPTNPLVQTADIHRLRSLADHWDIPLVLDPSIASPHNVQVLPFADAHINSLTKYAAPAGDVMLGALALNAHSPWADRLRPALPEWLAPPFEADLARLAAQIGDYHATVSRLNATTPKVAAFLEQHPGVDHVWWACSPPTSTNFVDVQQSDGGPGSIITFTIKKPLAAFYDRLRMAKGPSFGVHFSLLCPFLYLAHYDLVRTSEGREHLRSAGLPPDLLRLSVGLEPPEDIIAVLDEALAP